MLGPSAGTSSHFKSFTAEASPLQLQLYFNFKAESLKNGFCSYKPPVGFSSIPPTYQSSNGLSVLTFPVDTARAKGLSG